MEGNSKIYEFWTHERSRSAFEHFSTIIDIRSILIDLPEEADETIKKEAIF
jgi:hypothetical protein